MIRHASYFMRRTEKPCHLVDLMRAIEQNPAPQFAARGVTLAVVLPRAPVWQVASGFHVRPKDLPHHALLDQLLQFLYGRVKTQVVSHLNHGSAVRRFRSQFLHSVDAIGKGFLEKDVRACAQSLHGLRDVMHRWSADQNRIRLKLIESYFDRRKAFDLKL